MKLSDIFRRRLGARRDSEPEAVPIEAGRARAAFSASLTFEGVERRYGETMALSGVSLDIAPGEVVCLLGPSGCGKTTLLRIASGIEKPSKGRVLISGREVAGPARFVPPEERHVGLMFQDFALFPHLTILENVAFGLRSLPKEEARREALTGLARVGLERTADAYPHTLSGGQQQRVALARALVPRPSVVLMDEPFSGLDVQLRTRLQDDTLALLRETRATSMIVTHHPDEAMRLGDRIVVMRDGRIVQAGTLTQLYREPVDLFVARLFSEINEIPWTVEGGALRTPVGTFVVPELAEGDPAVLGIRQRAIRFARPGQGQPARIKRLKILGDAAILEVAVQGFDQPLKVRIREMDVPQTEGEIAVVVDPERVLVFPAEATEKS